MEKIRAEIGARYGLSADDVLKKTKDDFKKRYGDEAKGKSTQQQLKWLSI